MDVRLRRWPWSLIGSDDLSSYASADFSIMPTLEVPEEISLFRSRDKFSRLGGKYRLSSIDSYRSLFEFPILKNTEVALSRRSESQTFSIEFRGLALEKSESTENLVESWIRIFDELSYVEERPPTWSDIAGILSDIAEGRPERSVIVTIADKFMKNLSGIVNHARQLLMRSSEAVRLEKLRESDKSFLRWSVRQQGESIAEKAGSKRQVPGVVRYHSFDTLENRVLKKFISLCIDEAQRYLISAQKARYDPNNPRITRVFRYRNLCRELIHHEIFNGVQDLSYPVQANYVLQTDIRYREVWRWYQKLARRKLDKDQIWAWQGIVWADVIRLLIGAVFSKERTLGQNFNFSELKKGFVDVHTEQISGRRLVPVSLPGPFHLKLAKEGGDFIVDFVDPSTADDHLNFQLPVGLSLGAHLYLVIKRIGDTQQKPTIVAVWALNCLCAENQTDVKKAAEDAQKSLAALRERAPSINFLGIVAINNPAYLEKDNILNDRATGDIISGNPSVFYLQVPNHPRRWKDAIDKIDEYLSFFLEFACDAH